MNIYSLVFLIFLIFIVKFLFLVFFNDFDLFGGGNDSEYYEAYALGHDDLAVNIWPEILRFLAEHELYSRAFISHILMFLSILVIPYIIARLVLLKDSPVKNNVFLSVFLLISIYPNVFFLSLDIYRDIFMIFIFLLGLIILKKLSTRKNILIKIVYFFTGLTISFVLYEFRPYLGFGYFSSLVFSWMYSFKRYPFYTSVFALFLALIILNFIDAFEPILRYRDIFNNGMEGGSNIGIVFDSKMTFGFDFIKSFLYQMMGFYFPNKVSVLAFLSESIIFIFAFVYLVKNREYSNRFVDYLVVFFVVYSVVWLLGNDNLGSATRLRMFNYIVVYIGAFVVYQNKIIYNQACYNK